MPGLPAQKDRRARQDLGAMPDRPGLPDWPDRGASREPQVPSDRAARTVRQDSGVPQAPPAFRPFSKPFQTPAGFA